MSAEYTVSAELDRNLSRWMQYAGGGGLVFLVISVIGAFFMPAQFFRAYLFGYLFWLGLALGSMALMMTQFLTGGAWGVVTRRILESASRTLPLLAVLFIPVAAGMTRLYPWTHPDKVAQDDVLKHRSFYMNPEFFVIRAFVYFAIWLMFMWLLNRWSREEDEGGNMQNLFERLSAPGLIIYVFTVTFSSVDWAESLFSHWYSTMWGFLFVAGQGLTAMGLAILTVTLLARFRPMSEVFRPAHLHDLGKLLLMFVMLWAYFAFSQLLIVWSGNLNAEISWFLPRWHGAWAGMGGAIALLEFFIPFLLLLSRPLKRNWRALSMVVALLLVMRLADLYWIVMPAFHRSIALNWLQFSVPLAQGGIWTAAFLWQLKKRPLLPLGAPNLEAALKHGG